MASTAMAPCSSVTDDEPILMTAITGRPSPVPRPATLRGVAASQWRRAQGPTTQAHWLLR
jgi:hypothetical protein